MQNKFYLTTPIYYVNGKPHLGHLYSTMLADVITRWEKLKGKEVFFLTGLDEHGQKVAQAAEAAGKDPQAFVDSMVPAFTDCWKLFGIEYDKFIRTSDPEHKEAVQKLMQKLLDSDQLYKSSYSGFYCTPCETFINPQEAKESADKSEGKVLCHSCQREAKEISEESFFFRLSAWQDKLLEFYESNPDFIQPKERLNEVISFVKGGLKDLSFSRKSVKWGVPMPGDEEHTVYVWGDALTNYISAIGYGKDEATLEQWWPADLHVLAKDILRFHAVYWPAILMAAGLPMPKRELVHGYVIIDNQKMSKSLGNSVEPANLANWYGTEQVRYYLARTVPTTQDGNFSLVDLEECVRADLANNLGNLLSRATALASRAGLTELPAQGADTLDPDCKELLSGLASDLEGIKKDFDQQLIHMALAGVCKQLSNANALFHKLEPWKLSKSDPDKFAQVIWSVLCTLKVCGTLLYPVIPAKAGQLLASIGHELTLGQDLLTDLCSDLYVAGFKLSPLGGPLFERPEEYSKKLAESENKKEESVTKEETTPAYADITDFVKIEMHVGKIVEAEAVAKSDKLLKLQVDFGPAMGQRQVLSGIAKYYQPGDIIGRHATFVTNLKPRKMMGMESQGMLLCASDEEGRFGFLEPDRSPAPGTKVS